MREGLPDPSSLSDFSSRLRQQELVAEFGLFAMQARDLQAILDEATVVAAEGLGTRFAKVLEHCPLDRAFLVRAGVGWRQGVVGHARLGEDLASPAGYAFLTSEPVVSNHLGSEARFRTPGLLVEHGIHSAINVIVGAREDVPFGVLEVDSTSRDRFVAYDTQFLQGLANTLASALQLQKRQDAVKALLQEKEHLIREKDGLLREKELLMREVDHRISNSLQIVRTVLILQARSPINETARQVLEQAASRIMAIGAVHRFLYQSPTSDNVDSASFLEELLDELRRALIDDSSDRLVRLVCQPIQLTSEVAMSVGLIITELVVNALKHGRGEVLVTLSRPDTGLEIVVEDEGGGFPPDLDPSAALGLGMRLVLALAKSRNGFVQIDPSVAFSRISVRLQ